MREKTRFRGPLFYAVIFAFVLLVASLPLLAIVFFRIPGQDLAFHVQRIIFIRDELMAGRFPARIYTEAFDGYGYGAPIFYPDIFLYIPALLNLLGIPVLYCYNLFVMGINLVTLLAAVYSFTVISDSKPVGALSGILYELAIYRLLDIYTRASMGEYLALAFMPLCLCGLVLLKRADVKRGWKVLFLGFSGLLQSHILSFTMVTLAAAGYILCNLKYYLKKDVFLGVLKAAGATVAVSLWFLVPFLRSIGMDMEVKVTGGQFILTDTYLVQMFDMAFSSADGNEIYFPVISEQMTKTIGLPLILGTLLFVLYVIVDGRRTALFPMECGFMAAGLLALLATTSFFPWQLFMKIPVVSTFIQKFQFMWRFNMLAVLFLPVPAARGWYSFLDRYIQKWDALVLVSIGACLCAAAYLSAFTSLAETYSSQMFVEDVLHETQGMDTLYLLRGNTIFEREPLESNAEGIQYTDVERGNAEVTLTYHVNEPGPERVYIDVPIAYYPGYAARIDGSPAETACSPAGVVRVCLPEDVPEGTLTVSYEECTAYKIADGVSAASIAACLIGFGIAGCKRLRRPKAPLPAE